MPNDELLSNFPGHLWNWWGSRSEFDYRCCWLILFPADVAQDGDQEDCKYQKDDESIRLYLFFDFLLLVEDNLYKLILKIWILLFYWIKRYLMWIIIEGRMDFVEESLTKYDLRMSHWHSMSCKDHCALVFTLEIIFNQVALWLQHYDAQTKMEFNDAKSIIIIRARIRSYQAKWILTII